jgi:hypothetical protein
MVWLSFVHSSSRKLEATSEELERHWKQVRGFGRQWIVHPHLEARNHRDNCVIRNQATMQVVRPTAKFAHLGRVWGRRRCSWPEVACAIAERHFPAFSLTLSTLVA